jgi:antitoxin YefM
VFVTDGMLERNAAALDLPAAIGKAAPLHARERPPPWPTPFSPPPASPSVMTPPSCRHRVRRASFAQCFGYTVGMTAVPLGDARDRLSEYVSEVERTHQRVTITRHGHPAAVLISADDLAAIEETLEVLGTPGAVEAINEGLADAAAGRFADNDALRSRYGIA